MSNPLSPRSTPLSEDDSLGFTPRNPLTPRGTGRDSSLSNRTSLRRSRQGLTTDYGQSPPTSGRNSDLAAKQRMRLKSMAKRATKLNQDRKKMELKSQAEKVHIYFVGIKGYVFQMLRIECYSTYF